MEYIALMIVCVILSMLICITFNRQLPIWFCNNIGWHLEPKFVDFDGCSFNGTCPRCRKFVMQDSQGNWF